MIINCVHLPYSNSKKSSRCINRAVVQRFPSFDDVVLVVWSVWRHVLFVPRPIRNCQFVIHIGRVFPRYHLRTSSLRSAVDERSEEEEGE